MFLKNDDIHLMIKMENIIGLNEKTIFGEDKSKKIWTDGMEITFDDFISYINLIDRILNNKKVLSDKSNAYNKAHTEKHRQHSKEYARRKKLRKEVNKNGNE